MEAGTDTWATWLATRRQGGPAGNADQLTTLNAYRDVVLEGARIGAGDTVLDVGCGDGLIGLAAARIVGDSGRVIFSDVSLPLLDRCRELVATEGLVDRCTFVQADAASLSPILDASVDVVTTRAVLIYVPHKDQALREFRRVLRADGRLSMLEPINSFSQPTPPGFFREWDVSSEKDLCERLTAADDSSGDPRRRAMVNFDERHLLRMLEGAGFVEVEMVVRFTVEKPEAWEWLRLLGSAPNPLAPTLDELVRGVLDDRDAQRFLDALRVSVEGLRASP
jgi:ubiquinone/menaquinone biosynthesis C-methylase UbiE